MSQPSQQAIEYLLANPDTARFFDQKYGEGSAKKVLDRVQQAQQPQQQTGLRPGEVISGAVTNIVPSTANLIADLFQTVTSPIQTTKGIWDIAAGALQKSLPKSVVDFIGADPRAQKAAEDVAQFYADRYGSMEAVKSTIANDPAAFMADVATILTGGAGASRAGGAVVARTSPTVGRAATTAADVLTKTASYVDPLSLTAKTVGGVLAVPGKIAPSVLSMRTSAGPESFVEAYRAGKAGGEEAKQFVENIRGQANMTDVLDAAKSNLEAMRKQRGEMYRANMQNIKNDKSILDFGGIDKAINSAFDNFTFKGKPKNELAIQKLTEARAKVDEWKSLDPAEFHTPEGMDALKQQVGQILEDLKPRTPSDTAVKGVYNAIRDEITKQAPTYSNTMKAYSDATEQLREVERSLSLGDKASADTAMRKLQSVMRNTVNTNWGQRLSVAKELQEVGGNLMLPALAGQALSEWAPRGIQRATAGGEAMLAASTLGPIAPALSLISSSPRVMGEAAFAAGRTAAIPSRVGRGLLDLEQMLPPELQITPRATGVQMPEIDYKTLNLLYQLRQREEENQQ